MAIRDKAMTEPMMYPCLKCGGYGPTNHDPDCPNKPITEPTMKLLPSDETLFSRLKTLYVQGNKPGHQSADGRDEFWDLVSQKIIDRCTEPPSPQPAPGDVMSEDVLKAISFLRNDAHDCVWIADLIERLARERNCYRNDAMRDRSRLRKAEAALAQAREDLAKADAVISGMSDESGWDGLDKDAAIKRYTARIAIAKAESRMKTAKKKFNGLDPKTNALVFANGKPRSPGIDPVTRKYSTAQMLFDETYGGDTSLPLDD